MPPNWYMPPMGTESIDTSVLDWKFIYIYQFTYDDEGHILSRLDSLNWSDDLWYEYTYNDASMITSQIKKTRYLHHDEWEPNWEKTDYYYENGNSLFETITSTHLGGEWVPGSKKAYLYYPSDSLHYQITYLWKNEAWQIFDTLEYVYEHNEMDQVISLKSKAEKWEYGYHSNGQIDSIFYEDVFNSQYRTDQYDSYGNHIVYKELYPPDPSLTTYRSEYYYKGFPAKVQDFEMGSFVVFPNPAKDVIQLAGDLNEWEDGPAEFRVYGLNGQLLSIWTLDQLSGATLNVSHLSEGMYILSLQRDQRTYRVKFIKN